MKDSENIQLLAIDKGAFLLVGVSPVSSGQTIFTSKQVLHTSKPL